MPPNDAAPTNTSPNHMPAHDAACLFDLAKPPTAAKPEVPSLGTPDSEADAGGEWGEGDAHERANQHFALMRADKAAAASGVAPGMVIAVSMLVARVPLERSGAIAAQLLSLLKQPHAVAHIAACAVAPWAEHPNATADALASRGPAPMYVHRWCPYDEFHIEPCVRVLEHLAASCHSRRQRRRVEGASFVFNTPVAVAAAAGDVAAVLSHVLRIDDGRATTTDAAASVLRLVFGASDGATPEVVPTPPGSPAAAGDAAAYTAAVAAGGGDLMACDVRRVHDGATRGLAPLLELRQGVTDPTTAEEEERYLRVTLANALVAAAIADHPHIVLALLAVVPLHILCDVLLTHGFPTRGGSAASIRGFYLPTDFYAACDRAAFGQPRSWAPIHFVAACGSAAFTSACLSIIAVADEAEPHFEPRFAGRSASWDPPFRNASAGAMLQLADLSRRVASTPQFATHRLCTVGTDLRTTPLQIAAATCNTAFLHGIAAHGLAFSRRADVQESYAAALHHGMMEELIVEAAGSGLVATFHRLTADPYRPAAPAALSRAADMALAEQHIGMLRAITIAGGEPTNERARATPVGILVQAHKAGAALPEAALARVWVEEEETRRARHGAGFAARR